MIFFYNFYNACGVVYQTMWSGILVEWKKLNVFKMRFTAFLQILELLSRSDWSGVSISRPGHR